MVQILVLPGFVILIRLLKLSSKYEWPRNLSAACHPQTSTILNPEEPLNPNIERPTLQTPNMKVQAIPPKKSCLCKILALSGSLSESFLGIRVHWGTWTFRGEQTRRGTKHLQLRPAAQSGRRFDLPCDQGTLNPKCLQSSRGCLVLYIMDIQCPTTLCKVSCNPKHPQSYG